MSKQITNEIIEEWLGPVTKPEGGNRFDLIMRRTYGAKYFHDIFLTQKGLEVLFEDNLVSMLYGTFTKGSKYADWLSKAESSGDMTQIRQLGKSTAHYIWNSQKRLAGRDDTILPGHGSKLVIRTKGVQAIGDTFKKRLLKIAITYMKSNFSKFLKGTKTGKKRNNLDTNYAKGMSERSQFLHVAEEEVGSFMTAKIMEGLMSDVIENDFIAENHAVILRSFEEYFGPLLARWNKNPDLKDFEISDTITVNATIGPRSKNSAGDSSTDWINIRPQIEKVIIEAFHKEMVAGRLVTNKGSRPFVDRVRERAATFITDGILRTFRSKKDFTVRTKRRIKEEKTKPTKGNVTSGRRRSKSKSGNVKRRPIPTGIKAQQSAAQRPANLIALLNNKLPDVVKKNMTSPRLQYQTGRFAGSVKVLNVTRNKRAPTVQYTYQRYPYEKFESDQDRDPKQLIDVSIREIAAKLMMGKFHTQRL